MGNRLEFDDIRLSFGTTVILSDIFVECQTNKIVGLLGRNGMGKSCLLNIVFGELAAESKSIRFDGIPISQPCKRPGLLKYLPQFNFLPKFLSLKRIFDDFNLDFSEFEKRFPEYKPKYKSKLSALSGGQLRFVEAYIILKTKAEFALLDEPFTHLMPLQIEKMIELMEEEKVNKGLLITDHIYQHIIDISDSLYVLASGKTHRIKNHSVIEALGYGRCQTPP